MKSISTLAYCIKASSPSLYRKVTGVLPRTFRALLYRKYFENMIYGEGDVKRVFERIHERNWWNSSESRSGFGSELERTGPVRAGLIEWMSAHSTDVSVLLDAPCGDFNWMRAVEFPEGVSYIGCDIVSAVIKANAERYGSPNRAFSELDIISGPLPHADAWLCRDALFHFPFSAGLAVIDRYRRSSIRYFLSTTYPAVRNDHDIKFGWFRPLNLSLPPFSLGEPDEVIPDTPEGEKSRVLGVWRNRSS